MKQAIGQTWIIQLMILFIFLFAGYVILTINYSRTIKLKNEVVSIIEKYEGLNDYSIELINNYLSSNTYTATGVCTDTASQGIYGAISLNSSELEEARPRVKYNYCIKKYSGANISNYYQVTIFYKFNLPIIGNAAGFTVKGTTNSFKSYDDTKYQYDISGAASPTRSPSPSPTPTPGTPDSPSATYTVSFNLNGGSGSISNQQVASGSRVTRPANPTRSGYTFNGWKLNGSAYNFTTPVTSDITLTADWAAPTIKEYIINRATELWSGFYDCTAAAYCEKTSLPHLQWVACVDYMGEYPDKYSSEAACKTDVENAYNSLPNRINK